MVSRSLAQEDPWRKAQQPMPVFSPVAAVQSSSHGPFCANPWTAARQASLSIKSRSLLKLMSVESVMPSNHLVFCYPLLYLPSVFYHGKLFSMELALPIRWAKYWSFSFSISPSNEYSGLISFRMDWFASKIQTKSVPLAVLPNIALTK